MSLLAVAEREMVTMPVFLPVKHKQAVRVLAVTPKEWSLLIGRCVHNFLTVETLLPSDNFAPRLRLNEPHG
jgi:hypothetical protein